MRLPYTTKVRANLRPNSIDLTKLVSAPAQPTGMELCRTIFKSPTNTPNKKGFIGLLTAGIKLELRLNHKSAHCQTVNYNITKRLRVK